MSVKINNIATSPYVRKYFLPEIKGSWAKDSAGFWNDNESYGRYYTYKDVGIAKFWMYRHVRMSKCPECGLELYGEWFESFFNLADAHHKEYHWTSIARPGETIHFFKYDAKKLKSDYVKERNSYEPIRKQIHSEIQQFESITECPICGTKYRKKDKYSKSESEILSKKPFTEKELKHEFDYHFGVDEDEFLSDSTNILKNLKKNCKPLDIDIDGKKISSDMVLLKSYLEHLIKTELTIQMLESRLEKLYFTRDAREASYKLKGKETFQKEVESLMVNTPRPTLSSVKLRRPLPVKPKEFKAVPPKEPVYRKPGLFNKKSVLNQNAILLSDYQKAKADYDTACAMYQRQLDNYNHAIELYNLEVQREYERLLEQYNNSMQICEERKRKFKENLKGIKEEAEKSTTDYAIYSLIIQEIKSTEQLLSKGYSCLDALYDCNVVYKKYRNITALSTFYEYLDSGRCEKLTGANGAYNLYESEQKMDLVLTKIDIVINKLDSIQLTLKMLYSSVLEIKTKMDDLNDSMQTMCKSIEKTNKNLEHIATSTDVIAHNSAVIAHNSAVSAYYNKKTAELTNAIGFLVALK